MAVLPTNYLDDILSASMGGKRRFKITHLNGTSEEVTIEDISKYDQVGSTFGAGDINKTNQAVNEKFDSGDVVDPMLATEEGFAADAYQTKLQFDAQNKNFEWKLAGSVTGTQSGVSVKGLDYNEILLYVKCNASSASDWADTSLVVPKVALENRRIINMPTYIADTQSYLYCVCEYASSNESFWLYTNKMGTTNYSDSSTLYVYYR